MTPNLVTRQRYESIVVPVDGSELSHRAVAEGKLLAESLGASLRLFHVDTQSEKKEEAAHRDAEQLSVDLGVPADIRQNDGGVDVATAIDHYAAEHPNAVVCMATHGRGRVLGALMGSVTSKLVAEHDRPVIVVGPHATEQPQPITRVVACLDSSTWSEQILSEAVAWARDLNVPLWLVEVIEPVRGAAADSDVTEDTYLHRIATGLRSTGLDLEWEVLHDSHPAKAILRYVGSQPGTLTAMATHGRTGLRKAMMGSVATDVVRHAQGPLVLIRPSGEETGS